MKYYYTLFSMLIMLLVFPVGSQAGYVTIPADTLQKWITDGTSFDFLLIDVRETSETNSGVIATDICKPYVLPWTSGVFTKTIKNLPKDTAIICYCATGHRSPLAAQQLIDSGFVKVYSLNGGFTGWGSRPTKPASETKSINQLPEPSMFKKAAMIFSLRNLPFPPQEIRFSCNTITVTSPIAARHTLSLFNAQGKCVLNKQNPFVNCTVWPLNRLSDGFYTAKLESSESQFVEAVRIIK
jgi:rhodanese-related sulfurtransferase